MSTTGRLFEDIALIISLCAILFATSLAQQNSGSNAPPLAITTESLWQGTAREDYHFQLQATGGKPPLRWSIAGGEFPSGMTLDSSNGTLSGTPATAGDFHFSVTVADSGTPAHSVNKEFTLRVVAPLLLQWSRLPRVQGTRVEGSVKVSNDSSNDFDLTVIVVGVNEFGKAFALGYEHVDLKTDTANLEIPFGSTVPQGAYVVHADAIAEVMSKNAIYRQRLQTPAALQVSVGP